MAPFPDDQLQRHTAFYVAVFAVYTRAQSALAEQGENSYVRQGRLPPADDVS